jgi:hypothetical protein
MNKRVGIPEKEMSLVLQGGGVLVRMVLERIVHYMNLSLKWTLKKYPRNI